jgi:hypothetical protein
MRQKLQAKAAAVVLDPTAVPAAVPAAASTSAGDPAKPAGEDRR